MIDRTYTDSETFCGSRQAHWSSVALQRGKGPDRWPGHSVERMRSLGEIAGTFSASARDDVEGQSHSRSGLVNRANLMGRITGKSLGHPSTPARLLATHHRSIGNSPSPDCKMTRHSPLKLNCSCSGAYYRFCLVHRTCVADSFGIRKRRVLV